MNKFAHCLAVPLMALAVCSSSARYLQADPLGADGGLNVYVYSNANPLAEIDPLGLQSYIRPRRPGWPDWAQPTNPVAGCATAECAAGMSPMRPTPYAHPDFNKDPCVDAYLRQNYGNLMADGLVQNFSGLSYLPGSGYANQAAASGIMSVLTKTALLGAASGVATATQAMGAAGAGVAGGSSSAALIATGTAATAAGTALGFMMVTGGTAATAYSTAANAAALLHCSCRR